MNILVVDDDIEFLKLISVMLKKLGHKVITKSNYQEALDILTYQSFDLILLDQYLDNINGIEVINKIKNLTDTPIVIITAYGDIHDAIESIKKGAFHYILKPINIDELKTIIDKIYHLKNLNAQIEELKKLSDLHIVAKSKKMIDILEQARKIAPFDITVLITGETGTGKEILARYIHQKSKRNNNPFIPVNCGAIPRDLLESELFGYEKGAFTGADRKKKGLIEEADGGTLFLDEIGELPIDLQVKLLRVLEEGEIRPLGSVKPKKVDVRFIAATNKDLKKLIKEGKFREDLFYRLNAIHFYIPPLRERKEDIIPLAMFFIKVFSIKYAVEEKVLSKKAKDQLLNYHWPGNIRELKHVIEKAIITAKGKVIDGFSFEENQINIKPFKEAKMEFEKNYIENLLKYTNWNISKASKIAKKTRAEIYRLIQKYNIKRD